MPNKWWIPIFAMSFHYPIRPTVRVIGNIIRWVNSVSVIQLARFICYKISNLVKSSAVWNTTIKRFCKYMDIVLPKALWTENECLFPDKCLSSWGVYSNIINLPWGGTLIDPQWMVLFNNRFITHQWLSLDKMLGVYVRIADPMNNTSANMAACFVRTEVG